MRPVGGAILAGGKATRWGGIAKGLVEVAPGVTMLDRARQAMEGAGVRGIVIIATNGAPYAALGLPVIPDLRAEAGPLAGIEAALAHHAARHEATLILPCDLPGITAREARLLRAAFEETDSGVVVAVTRGSLWHPLCAVVHDRILPLITAALDHGERSVRRVWQEAGAAPVHFADPTPFINANTPEDLAQWQAEKR